MEEIQNPETSKELKHVETVDKAQPVIDENTKIKKSNRPKLMNEVKTFKGFQERKQEYENKVQEQTQTKDKVLDSIKTGKVELAHVETVDKSQPVIEAVPVRKNVHSKVMEEIQKVESKELKHVETVDKAKPTIDADAHVKQSSRPKLLKEVRGLSEKLLKYEQNVTDSQKLSDEFRNREGGDVSELSRGISAQKKMLYEQTVEESKKSTEGSRGKEAVDLDAVGEGVAQKVKTQYQKEVEEKMKSPEGVVKEKEGDKVVYKNLPPKKDLNDLI